MEKRWDRRRWGKRNASGADDIAAVLRRCWYRLRLSVRDPSRVPTWDAVVLTAASPEQAALYDWQLRRAKRFGRIAPSTVTLAVPDPDAARIGSGAATLHAISSLARHLLRLGLAPPQETPKPPLCSCLLSSIAVDAFV